MPTYTIFAGVNGAGKTSIYKCAREAVKLIDYYIKNNISFNQETTLSGKSIVRNIKTAKEKGFYVVMN